MDRVLARLWLAAAALCLGTALGPVVSPALAVPAAAIGAVGLAIRRFPVVGMCALCLTCAGAGAMNVQVRSQGRGAFDEMAHDVPGCEVDGLILESIGGLGSLVVIRSARCEGWNATSGIAVLRDQVGEPGSGFVASGWLVPLSDDQFDRALARHGAEARLHPSHIELTAPPGGVHGIAAGFRERLRIALSGLAPERSALLEGLTIGDTSGMSAVAESRFRDAGLSHVLAVSGSNVAIVLTTVMLALRALGLKARIGAGYLALAFFVLVVGPDASVLRAAAMGAIVLACLLHGRTSEPLAALALAVIAVVGLRPAMLCSVGMHLSVAATAGIVIFGRPLVQAFRAAPRWLATMMAATIAAQVAVAPILILVFGELSLASPLANLLALPAVGPATVIGLCAATVAVASPRMGRLVALPLGPLAAWILGVAERMGSTEWAAITVPDAFGWGAALAVLASAWHELRRQVSPR